MLRRGRRTLDGCPRHVHRTDTSEHWVVFLHLQQQLDAVLPTPVGVSVIQSLVTQ